MRTPVLSKEEAMTMDEQIEPSGAHGVSVPVSVGNPVRSSREDFAAH